MYSVFWHCTLCIFFVVSMSLMAQEPTSHLIHLQASDEIRYDIDTPITPLSLEKSVLEKYKKDKEFNYTESNTKDNWWNTFTAWLNKVWNKFILWIFGHFEENNFLRFFIKILPYLIVGGLIVFIFWLFYKLNPAASILASKEKPQVFFTEEEEIIRSRDIKKLIENALGSANYRLAVRYYYLFILKQLSDNEIIDYQYDKTNSDYFKEITSDNINVTFKKATNLYDYIWYGNFSVTKDDYQRAQQRFVQLESDISKIHD